MAKRRPKYPEKPWIPDPEKWRKLLEKKESAKHGPLQPKGGWQLWRWDNLSDAPQDETTNHVR